MLAVLVGRCWLYLVLLYAILDYNEIMVSVKPTELFDGNYHRKTKSILVGWYHMSLSKVMAGI